MLDSLGLLGAAGQPLSTTQHSTAASLTPSLPSSLTHSLCALWSGPPAQVLGKLGFLKGGKINRSHIIVAKGGQVLEVQYGITPKVSVKEAVEFCLEHKGEGAAAAAAAEEAPAAEGAAAAAAGEAAEAAEEQREGPKEEAPEAAAAEAEQKEEGPAAKAEEAPAAAEEQAPAAAEEVEEAKPEEPTAAAEEVMDAAEEPKEEEKADTKEDEVREASSTPQDGSNCARE